MTDENCENKMAAVTGSSRMIRVEEALKMVLNASQQLPPIKVSIHNALGKILAEGVKAFDPLPTYPASIKMHSYDCWYDYSIIHRSFLKAGRRYRIVLEHYLHSMAGYKEVRIKMYAVVASNGSGDYPVSIESRAANDLVGLTVTSGAIAYVTTLAGLLDYHFVVGHLKLGRLGGGRSHRCFFYGTTYDGTRLLYLDKMGGIAITMPKKFTLFSSFAMASLALKY